MWVFWRPPEGDVVTFPIAIPPFSTHSVSFAAVHLNMCPFANFFHPFVATLQLQIDKQQGSV